MGVLIDTWWNVNKPAQEKVRAGTLVLIDTWWNVNSRAVQFPACTQFRFNRYMVECE